MSGTNENMISNEVLLCLKNVLNELQISNYTTEISQGSGFGENFAGVMAKVEVTGLDKKNKTSTTFMIKSAPCHEKFRSLFPVRQSFEREDYVYRIVLPEFVKLLSEKHITSSSLFVKFYKSTMEYMNEAIIMEDMKQYGFRTYNRYMPVDYNHALLVMQEYGRFHAMSFALRDQKPEIFDELSRNTPDTYFSGKNGIDFLKSVQPQGLRALKALDKTEDTVVYNKFMTFQENMVHLFLETVKPEAAGKYAVICHGDCWLSNHLFRYADPKHPQVPTEMCLIDWQIARSGSPVLDLSYFIFTCTDKELRDAHYNQLLDEYYKSFCNYLRKLGSDPDILFPYEVLQEHLKKFSIHGLFMTIISLFMLTSEPDEIPDIYNASDVDNMTEILKFESKNIEKYNARIRGVILDYVKFDYEL